MNNFSHLQRALRLCIGFVIVPILLAGCGATNQDKDYQSDLLGVSGSGEHEICGTEVNARRISDLSVIDFVSNQGERVWPKGQTQQYLDRQFQLVEFKDRQTTAWVANDYICKAGVLKFGAARIDINLTSNRLTFYRGPFVIRAWNVATARAGKNTPTGNFEVKIKENCPRYLGAEGDKNVAGCIPENPLGTRALWFIDTIYGLHGTNREDLIAEGTTAEDRRLSAGCIRNANANIEWLFNQVKLGDAIVIHR